MGSNASQSFFTAKNTSYRTPFPRDYDAYAANKDAFYWDVNKDSHYFLDFIFYLIIIGFFLRGFELLVHITALQQFYFYDLWRAADVLLYIFPCFEMVHYYQNSGKTDDDVFDAYKWMQLGRVVYVLGMLFSKESALRYQLQGKSKKLASATSVILTKVKEEVEQIPDLLSGLFEENLSFALAKFTEFKAAQSEESLEDMADTARAELAVLVKANADSLRAQIEDRIRDIAGKARGSPKPIRNLAVKEAVGLKDNAHVNPLDSVSLSARTVLQP